MVFQIPDTIEKKLSVKLKIAMVVGSVVVLVGATFAGYYFGQKKNAGQSSVVQNNDNTLPSTDTAGEIIPDPITVPDGAYNPLAVSFPTTSLPQEIEQKIVWLQQPKEIAKLNWLPNDKGLSEEEEKYMSNHYNQVGSFEHEGEKGRVLLLNLASEGPGSEFVFYIIDFKKQIIVLTKYSRYDGNKPSLEYSDDNIKINLAKFLPDIQKLVKLDSNFTIDLLDFPQTLAGIKDRQVVDLTFVSYALPSLQYNLFSKFKTIRQEFLALSLPKFGKVYTSGEGSFYVYGAHGTVAIYTLRPDFFDENSRAQITWNDGSQNTYDFTYTDRGGCGWSNSISVVTSTDIKLDKDLEVIGKNNKGDFIYGLKDKDHRLLKYLYELTYQGGFDGKKVSYEEFLTQKPVVFWVDPFGRLIKMENLRFGLQAECGKPVIYLYPEKTSIVDVKVEPQGGMTVSDPFYNGGWQVKAEPNGQLTETKSGKQYPYLFWEGRGGLYQTPERGFLMKKENVAKELPEKLAQLGLNANETKDFMEFWYPRMQAKPYYFVTFLGTQQMNQLAPLTINPRPDTVVRILMDFTPLDKPVDFLPLSLGRIPERKGFTVIEWGGVLR